MGILVRATADLHGDLPPIDPCDLLLVAGDVMPVSNHRTAFQRNWLVTTWRDWLAEVPAEHIVWVAGNHDLILEHEWSWRYVAELPRNTHYLRDSSVEVCGLLVYGFPWCFNPPGGWAFEAFNEAKMYEASRRIPDNADIVITHSPPSGFGETTFNGLRAGSAALGARLRRIEPRLAIFGHVHEGYGRWQFERTTLANVSRMDFEYQPTNPVQSFEV